MNIKRKAKMYISKGISYRKTGDFLRKIWIQKNHYFGMIFLCVYLFLPGCSSKPSTTFPGYVDSKLRFIASNFSGLVTKLYVTEGDSVRRGKLLFILERFPEEWRVDQALAKVATMQAQVEAFTIKLKAAEEKVNRRKKLKVTSFVGQEEMDTATTDFALAQAQLSEAKASLGTYKAQLYEAQWAVNKKRIFADINASIFEVFYYENEIVPAERPVLSLLAPEDIKIIFFIPENQLNQVKIGQTIYVTYDGRGNDFQAKITFISAKPEFAPPVIFSEEIRAKLVFLIEARTDLEISKQLHLGQPVSVRLKR